MSIDESNPLYDACVGFMVAEKSEADSWAKVARLVQTKVDNGVGDVAVLKAEFAVVEKQIKHDFGVTTLPTTWRTAKSSSLAAARAGVSLTDEAGNIKPKSALEDEVRIKIALDRPVESVSTEVVRLLTEASNLMHLASWTSVQQRHVDYAINVLRVARGRVTNA